MSHNQVERVTGKIVRVILEKGFGFIQDAAGKEYFFHRSAVNGRQFELLREQETVTFEPTSGQKGLRAEDVQLAE